VKGTNGITADMIADTNSKCPWMNHMYGLNMKKPGAQEYLNSILELYAEWGVDFIKVDDLSRPYSEPEVEGYYKAIEHSGRPIVLSRLAKLITCCATPTCGAWPMIFGITGKR
jgi:hypothetical protein